MNTNFARYRRLLVVVEQFAVGRQRLLQSIGLRDVRRPFATMSRHTEAGLRASRRLLLQHVGLGCINPRNHAPRRVAIVHRCGGFQLFLAVGIWDVAAFGHRLRGEQVPGRWPEISYIGCVKPNAAKDVERELEHLDFSQGLSRDDVRRRMPHLPEEIYLELPASKRYRSAAELMHDALNARNRAEGEIVREDFDAYGSSGAQDDGGPAAWGEDPIIASNEESRGT